MTDAPKLLPDDKLREGYPKINKSIDNANEALSRSLQAESTSSNAVSIANNAVNTASAAETTANSVQEQLDVIIINNGQSDAEVLQARVDEKGVPFQNIKERIDAEQKKIGILQTREVNIESFPIQLPELDDAARFTRALNSLSQSGGIIVLPQGKTYKGNLTVSKSNIVITGGGTLKGCFNLYGTDTSGMDRFSGTGNVVIDNITIDGERLRNGINNKWFFGVTITNVTFKNCLKAIYFEQIPKGQHCSRYTITNNDIIDCQYGLYVDYVTPTAGELSFVVGDITFSHNMYESRSNTAGKGNIYHIWAKGLDGFICKGNTLFFAHTGDEISNIYLDTFNWAIIQGNNIFEPKVNGIRALNGNNLIITSNNIAWSGAQAIYLTNISTGSVNGNNITFKDDSSVTAGKTGVFIENSPYFIGSVSDNTIMFPNEYAIKINDSSNITVNGNNARNKYSTLEPVGINSFTNCSNIMISSNLFTGYTKKLKDALSNNSNKTIYYVGNGESIPAMTQGVFSPSYKSYTNNSTSIDIADTQLVVFANSSPTTITQLTTENLNNNFPRIVTMYSYNGNTSISRSIQNTTVKGTGVSITIPAGESMTFLVYGGGIKELNRSFPIT